MRRQYSEGILFAGLIVTFVVGGFWIAWPQWTAPTAVEPPQGAAAPGNTPAGKYFIEGTVREEQTREPVSGAKIQFVVKTETDPKKRVRKGTTDEQGRYQIEVPLGGVNLWYPELKPGYRWDFLARRSTAYWAIAKDRERWTLGRTAARSYASTRTTFALRTEFTFVQYATCSSR